MSQSTELHVPDGYYPPFAVVSDDDHSAYIIIAVALGLALVLLSSLIRVFMRTTSGLDAGLDDAFLAAATILLVVQSGVILGACANGLGRDITTLTQSEIGSVERSFYTSNILMILILGLAKCCVGIFILRLTPIDVHRRIAYGIIVATAAWTIGSVFANALQCGPSRPWQVLGQQCDGVHNRLLTVCIFDILLEVALVLTTAVMVSPLKTALSNKFKVFLAFSFRLPLIIAIAYRLHTFHVNEYTSNFTLLETSYLVCTQVELSYSIISATIPILRPLINNLSTHYGAVGEGPLTGSGSRSRIHANSNTNTSDPITSGHSGDHTNDTECSNS